MGVFAARLAAKQQIEIFIHNRDLLQHFTLLTSAKYLQHEFTETLQIHKNVNKQCQN